MMLTLLASALLPVVPAQNEPPPNVLVIVLDDVGVDQVGCYAADYPGLAVVPCTPNIDALAATGVRFTNAWSNPVCSPTRAQILTGKPAHRTGVGAITFRGPGQVGNHGLQPFEPTLASMLPGYATAAVGKWHVSDPDQDGVTYRHPLDLGFESFAGSLYGLDPDYVDWTKCVSPPGTLFPSTTTYATTDTSDAAVALLTTLPEPWFLYVGYNAAHSPFHCPEDIGFDPGECDHGACLQDWCQGCNSLLATGVCANVGDAACRARAMVHAMDTKIGQLLDSIDPLDTAVILIGDNGTPPSATVPPFRRDHSKGTLFQGSIHVPLVLRVPGIGAGENHELVSATDVFATVADVSGAHPAPDPHRESISLLSTYANASSDRSGRSWVYSEYFSPNFVPVNGEPPPGYVAHVHHRAIRNQRFKLIDMSSWSAKIGACVSDLRFFRLADAPPQNPAFGPDPFELTDLMPSQASWTLEEQTAFAELTLALDTYHPRLPTACP